MRLSNTVFFLFFAIAQTLKIEFLSITWQSTRQKTKKNDIFKIHETFANIQMNFAFKRVKNDEKFKKIEAEIFQMLNNEIIVLSYSLIQKHSNIVKLQNTCWNIFEDNVWSVLIFEKSQFNDLYGFAARSIEKELNIHHRFKICVEIEKVIIYMHSHSK